MRHKINSKCSMCNERFSNTYKKVYVTYPCVHLIHSDCYVGTCNICNREVLGVGSECTIDIYSREYNDMCSVINHRVKKNVLSCIRAFRRIILLALFLLYIWVYQIFFEASPDYFSWKCDIFLYIFGISVDAHGIENITADSSIFVFNHSSLLDIFVVGKMSTSVSIENKKGFFAIASEISLKSKIMQVISKGADLILVKRNNNDESTFDKINKKMSEHKMLAIFPQGVITNNNTISEFRNTAFNLDKHVNPIVIKYNPIQSSMLMEDLLFSNNSRCDVYCLKKIYKKDPHKFRNEVMKKMIGCGRFKFSRITSRDVYD